jgi:hypothetical protein
VRGSPAGIRILVIDSCRSGSITRVKGGSPAPPLVIGATTSPLQGEGMIVSTASTLSEDAHGTSITQHAESAAPCTCGRWFRACRADVTIAA